MNQFIKFSKKELVDKFGLRYYISKDFKTMKDSITEVFGKKNYNDIFETKSYDSIEEALKKIIQNLEIDLESESLIKKVLEEKLSSGFLSKIFNKNKLKYIKIYENKVNSIKEKIEKKELDVNIEIIPEVLYFPEIHFEYDKTYYLYQDIKSSKTNKIIELKVKHIEFLNQHSKEAYSMRTTFIADDNSIFNVNEKEMNEFNGKYFIADYTNYYVFSDFEKAKSLVSEMIKNEINDLENSLKFLNHLK